MAKRNVKHATKSKHGEGSKHAQKEPTEPKVGSDRAAAEHFADGGDFGIPAEDAGRFTEAAQEAKYQPGGDHLSDPRPPRSGGQATRESGVGGVDSGPGSSSGGDLDTDVIGVGTHGTGVAASGPDERTAGADMTSGGTHKRGRRSHRSKNKTSGGEDVSANLAEAGDDAAAGEISQGEAAGDDNTEIDNLS